MKREKIIEEFEFALSGLTAGDFLGIAIPDGKILTILVKLTMGLNLLLCNSSQSFLELSLTLGKMSQDYIVSLQVLAFIRSSGS